MIVDRLSDATFDPLCPSCNSQEARSLAHQSVVLSNNPANVMDTGLAMVFCKQCGHTSFYDLGILGIG